MRQVEKQHEVEDQGCGEYRIAAEEVYFDLHRIAEPSEDIDIVPSLLGIAARWIVIDSHLVKEIAVKLRVHFRLKNLIEHREFGFFFRPERAGIVEHFAVAITQDVGR